MGAGNSGMYIPEQGSRACTEQRIWLAIREAQGREPEDLSWQDQGVCAQVDPDLHFPGQGHAGMDARLVCRGCPVRAPCLDYALRHDERGVWGGTTGRQRRRMKREAA